MMLWWKLMQAKLANFHRSWTIWFNGVAGVLLASAAAAMAMA